MAEVLRVSDGERSELQNLQWECELLGLPSSFWIKQNIYGFCWVLRFKVISFSLTIYLFVGICRFTKYNCNFSHLFILPVNLFI